MAVSLQIGATNTAARAEAGDTYPAARNCLRAPAAPAKVRPMTRFLRNPKAIVATLLLLGWLQAGVSALWISAGIQRDPEAAIEAHLATGVAAMRVAFQRAAAKADRLADRLSRTRAVRRAVGRGDRESTREIFAAVLAAGPPPQAGGVEVVNAEGAVVAWNGTTPLPAEGPPIAGAVTRRIEAGGVHLWYVITRPLAGEGNAGSSAGSVRVGVPIESREGLHARFRLGRTLSEAAAEAGVAGARLLRGSIQDIPGSDGPALTRVPLDDQDAGLRGVIELPRPGAAALHAAATGAARLRFRLLTGILVLAAFALAARRLDRQLAGRPAFAGVALALLPWLPRYTLLIFDLPGAMPSVPMLNPGAYGNDALGGILVTPAEFLLTAATALASCSLWLARSPARRSGVTADLVGGILTAGGAVLLGLGVESVVRDSTLTLFDPASPWPGGAILALQAGLYLLTLTVLLLANAWVGSGLRSAGGTLVGAGIVLFPAWLLAGADVGAWTLPTAAALLGVGAWCGRGRPLVQRLILSALFSAAVLHVLFDAALEDDRRRRMLAAIPESLTPQEGFYLLTAERAAETLAEAPDVRALVSIWNPAPSDPTAAVDFWRRSLAAAGCDGSITLRDARGATIATLAVNFPAAVNWSGPLAPLPSEPHSWSVRLGGERRMDIYAALAPVLDPDGNPSGSILVAVSPPDRSLPSTSFPAARPAIAEERLRLPDFTATLYGAGNRLEPAPADITAHFSIARDPLWRQEATSDGTVDALYAPAPDRPGVVALRCARATVLERGARFLSLYLWHGTLALFAGALVAALRWLAVTHQAGEARRSAAKFFGRMENQLLTFFLAISLVPILALSVFSRALVSDRIESEVGDDALRAARLAGRFLALETQEAIARGTTREAAVPLDPFCRRFATLTGKDLSVYLPGRLGASSKPELYDLGSQPRRVPARAYRALALEGADEWLEVWTVGGRTWRVGFHAVREADQTTRIFAVPVLFHRRDVEEQTGRATVMIFGLYGLVVLGLWFGALALAERLTRPVRDLLEGTRRVAAGEVDFRILPRSAGEFAELIDGFNRMTADLKVSRENLARAERDAAWREMARQIAHEIKNPLTPMKLSAQQIARAHRDAEPDLGEIIESGVRTIVQQIDLLGRIATEFSTFARLPVGKRDRGDLNPLIQDTASLFTRLDPPEIRVTCDLAPDLPAVLMDVDEMRRVLTNLCRNAVQAMPSGGEITLSTRKSLGEDGKLRARVRISDTGDGIPAEILPRVFEPYFSTRSDGTGLGLAICRRIVEDLHGTISVWSQPHQGATFTLEFPAVADAPDPAPGT